MVLKGIRVIDMGNYITAPYATMLLAELGAEVIKIEQPADGDPFRSFSGAGTAPHFVAFNRNKKSVAIDIRNTEGMELLSRLLSTSDVLVMNMRPGAEARLGLGYDQVHSRYPRLIWCGITGFGVTGPQAARPAFDTVGLALSGLLHRLHDGKDPRIGGPAISDTVTGLVAALGVCGALVERASTGLGKRVDINMLEATLSLALDGIFQAHLSGKDPEYYMRGAVSQAYVMTCSDGLRLALHLSSPEKFWDALIVAIERKDLGERFRTRAVRINEYEALANELQNTFMTKPRDFWIDRLERSDIPFAPENKVSDLRNDKQLEYLGTFTSDPRGDEASNLGINRAIRYDGDNSSCMLPAPRLGQHTDEVLLDCGFSSERIRELVDSGIIRTS